MEGIIPAAPLSIAMGDGVCITASHQEIRIEGLRCAKNSFDISNIIRSLALVMRIKGVAFRGSDMQTAPSADVLVARGGTVMYEVNMSCKRRSARCAPIVVGADEDVYIKVAGCEIVSLRIKIVKIAPSMIKQLDRRHFLPVELGSYRLTDDTKDCPFCGSKLNKKFGIVREIDEVSVRHYNSICIFCPVCNRCKQCEKQLARYEHDVCARCKDRNTMICGGWE